MENQLVHIGGGENLTREQIDLLKRTVAKDSTDDEFALFIQLCRRRNLDPFCRQIYFTKKAGVITGIDGLRVIAERTGCYAPGDTTYIEDAGKLIAACVSIKKLVAGTWHVVTESAYLNEYQGRTDIWAKLPRVMLAKCAEARALRRAFPNELSGLYSSEELDQAQPAQVPLHQPVIPAEEARGTGPVVYVDPIQDLTEIIKTRLDKAIKAYEGMGISPVRLECVWGILRDEWGQDELDKLTEWWLESKKGDGLSQAENLDMILLALESSQDNTDAEAFQ